MPGFLLTVNSVVQCTHGGTALAVPSNTDVLADASPILVESDIHSVVGCPLNISGAPSPCLTVSWSAGASKVKVAGQPVLLQSSVGLCKNAAGAVQGVAIVSSTQTKVQGT